jgi:hypothetical protein
LQETYPFTTTDKRMVFKMLLHINKVTLDIRRRINLDTIDLEHDIRQRGLLVPIDVEGPDDSNNYYLINGDRRLEAWKNVRSNEPIKVNVVRELTSRLERNKERLQMHLDIKPMPGVFFNY